MNEAPVTRGEFDMLRQNLSDAVMRLNNLDSGKDGVAAMAVQVRELATDLGEMKADMNTLKADVSTRFDSHLKQHAEDLKARQTARKWMITTVITAGGAIGTMITMLLDILKHLH